MATLSAAAIGAFTSLAVLLGASWRQGFAPQRLLLAGVTVATIGATLATLVLTGGDGRLGFLLNWISGSTYRATFAEAEFAACAAGLMLAALPLLSRWLSILPLGKSSALGLGVHLTGANFVLLMIAALASAVATLTVGPLSFIGLMAPSLARMLGLARPAHQMAGAALLGGAIMAVSDLVGRTAAAPWQIPSGLVAACVGGPFCLWLLWQRR